MGIAEDALHDDLAALERFAFTHPLSQHATHLRHQIIAEACANTIGRDRRRQIHGAALAAILSRHSNLSGRHQQLAFHAEGAGDDMAALGYLWEAGLEARRSSAAASLNLIFDRALQVIGRLGAAADEKYMDFVLMAFASMVQLGEFDKVNFHLPRVMELVRRFDRPALTCSTLSQLGMIRWFEGRYAEGLRATEEGIAIARALESPALIFSNQIMQSNILHGMGEVRRAITEQRALCAMLTGELESARLGAAGIPSATALAFMSWFLVDVGQLDQGLEFAERGLAIAVREQDPYSEALARNALGRNLLLMGRDAEAATCLAIARGISERNGYDAIRPNLAGRAAAALSRIGRAREGLEIVEECLRLGLHQRTGQLEVYNLHIGHAEALYRSGDTVAGLDKLAEALAIARRTASPCLIVDGLGLRARLLAETAPADPRIDEDLAKRDALCRRHDLVAVPAFDRRKGVRKQVA
jgi:tetratricopeptide (TPR) repeat protein